MGSVVTPLGLEPITNDCSGSAEGPVLILGVELIGEDDEKGRAEYGDSDENLHPSARLARGLDARPAYLPRHHGWSWASDTERSRVLPVSVYRNKTVRYVVQETGHVVRQ